LFKLIILLNKKETLSNVDFANHLLDVHAPLAKRMPGLRKYVVNLVQKPPNKEPEFHGVVELWFDDRESMKKAFSSPEGEVTQKDTENFAGRTVTLFADEKQVQ
jgi:uncharacterized protein (TIGR02118 family)